GHLSPHLLQLRDHVVAQRAHLVSCPCLWHGSQALGQGPDNWVEQHEPSHHGDEEEEGDRFLRHHRLPGGASRSASRCLASSRSAKSMRSLNSLTSVRSPCTSPTTSERSASSSARTSSGSAAPPWRLIRSATALPTGEMASRNRVPPPKIKVIARTSSIATPPFDWNLPS